MSDGEEVRVVGGMDDEGLEFWGRVGDVHGEGHRAAVFGEELDVVGAGGDLRFDERTEIVGGDAGPFGYEFYDLLFKRFMR